MHRHSAYFRLNINAIAISLKHITASRHNYSLAITNRHYFSPISAWFLAMTISDTIIKQNNELSTFIIYTYFDDVPLGQARFTLSSIIIDCGSPCRIIVTPSATRLPHYWWCLYSRAKCHDGAISPANYFAQWNICRRFLLCAGKLMALRHFRFVVGGHATTFRWSWRRRDDLLATLRWAAAWYIGFDNWAMQRRFRHESRFSIARKASSNIDLSSPANRNIYSLSGYFASIWY